MEPALPSSEVLAQHGGFVRALAQRLLRDQHDADDLAQDAWVRYFEAPPRGALDPRGWFATVVANLARSSHRARDRRATREARAARSEALPSVDDELAQAAVMRGVVEAVLGLDEPYRGTVVARYFKGWEPARIASESGVPLATVKSRLQRAHALLRERLDETHGSRSAWSLALASLTDATRASLAVTTASAAKCALAVVFVAAAWLAWSVTRTEPTPPAALTASADAGEPLDAERAPSAVLATQPDGERAAVPSNSIGERTFRVSGRVLDLPYAPLGIAGGAAVDVEVVVSGMRGQAWSASSIASAVARTDSSGAFVVELECPQGAPESLRVRVEENDVFRGVALEEPVGVGAAGRADIEFVRAAHGFVEGRVVDALGDGVPHVRFALSSTSAGVADLDVEADANGRLLAPLRGSVKSVRVLDPRWKILSYERPSWNEGGGASGLEVVLADSARLALQVVDGRGRGVAGLSVRVVLHESERRTARAVGMWGEEAREGTTADDGSVLLESVWAGHRLSVVVAGERADAVLGEQLVFGDDAREGAPLVLVAGETRSCTATWNARATVRGRTLTETGETVSGATVELFDGVEGAVLGARARAATVSDGLGNYTLDVRARELSGRLRLGAGKSTNAWSHVAGALSSAHLSCSGAEYQGALLFDADLLAAGELAIDLRLAPTSTITGRALDTGGAALDGRSGAYRLRAAPSGASAFEADASSAAPAVEWLDDGRFEIRGLSPGKWDLFLSRVDFSFYSWEHGTRAFRGIDAGTSALELRYDAGREVRVKPRFRAADSCSGIALRAALVPRDPQRAFTPADARARVDSLAGWPLQAPLGFAGISGGEDQLGRWSFGCEAFEGVELDLPPMSAGVYAFGIAASCGEQALALQASEPLYYAGGDYLVEFVTVATTRLEGTVHGISSGERWAVELVASDGARIPLARSQGFERANAMLELDARGRFSMPRVPVGSFGLRVGRLRDLASGVASIESALELELGRSKLVELRLP
ncbi:MAG: sigma-70 family RNA polymerase sigma factor [Planctomycetes bacterium]|nr:sigma-70 family RNA polymerase sigma factor [Planctomycetota bacterium]